MRQPTRKTTGQTKPKKGVTQDRDMSEKLDGINDFRTKVLAYLNGELAVFQKALKHIDDHPLVESDAEVRKIREEQCRELRSKISEVQKHINVITLLV